MSTTTGTSLELKSPRAKSQALHIYDKAAGEFAREMGVQVRMLCGVWGWPAGTKGKLALASSDLTPRHCQRCSRSFRRERAR